MAGTLMKKLKLAINSGISFTQKVLVTNLVTDFENGGTFGWYTMSIHTFPRVQSSYTKLGTAL